MKKTYRISTALLTLCMLISGTVLPAKAAYEQVYTPVDAIEHTEVGPAILLDDGPALNSFISPCSIGDVLYERTYRRQGATYHQIATDTGNYIISEQFVQYLTSSWAKAESYVYVEEYEVSGQVQSGVDFEVLDGISATIGLSITKSVSTGREITIPADKTRDSKLALCADFYVQKYHYKLYENDILRLDKPNYKNTYPMATYIRVAYK